MKLKSLVFRDKLSKNTEHISLPEYYRTMNSVLFVRKLGGLGDIFMHRMMFEDIKKQCGDDIKITFAVPSQYIDAVNDHPYIDYIIDYKKIQYEDYGVWYDTSNACSIYESRIAPLSDKHRSDIWAEHCGITLQNHSMNFCISDIHKDFAKKEITKIAGDKPSIVLAPYSAIPSKNLDTKQINGLYNYLKKEYSVFILHNKESIGIDIPTYYEYNTKQLIAMVDASDYTIAVDTSINHLAGGLGKPTLGVYSWADGKVYGKYYPNFELVQKHRDNKDWDCGPCYLVSKCCKDRVNVRKPCITEITVQDIIDGFERLVKKCPK